MIFVTVFHSPNLPQKIFKVILIYPKKKIKKPDFMGLLSDEILNNQVTEGGRRIWTDDQAFAEPCLTTWLYRLNVYYYTLKMILRQ